VRGQLGVRRLDASDDLGGPVGEQLAGLSEADAASDTLQELRARLRLQPREVVADRRLRVVQLLRRLGDGSMTGHRVDDAQARDVQHASTLSMSSRENWHWTHGSIVRMLLA